MLVIVAQLRRTLLLHHSYTILQMNSSLTVEKEGPLGLLQFIQKYNLENSVPNIVIMLRIFLTIAVSVATC